MSRKAVKRVIFAPK